MEKRTFPGGNYFDAHVAIHQRTTADSHICTSYVFSAVGLRLKSKRINALAVALLCRCGGFLLPNRTRYWASGNARIAGQESVRGEGRRGQRVESPDMLTFHFQVAGVLLGAVLRRRRKVIDIWRISS